MDKLVRILSCTILVLGCFGLANVCIAGEPIKIGGMFALSGPWANIGTDQRDSCKFVFDKLNAEGGINGRKIEFIQADTEGDPTKALLAAKRLTEQEKVAAIIGPVRTGVGMAIKPYIDKAKIPTVMHCGGDVIVDLQPNHWVFKTPPRSSTAMERIFIYMKEKGIKKIGFMYIQGGFGKDALRNSKTLAPKYGIDVVGIESFGGKDVDMKPQLVSLRSKNPQAILVWAVGPAGPIIGKNMHEMGYKVPHFQSHGEATNQFIEIGGPAVEGVVLPAQKIYVGDELSDSDPQKALIVQFVKEYTKTYKQPGAMVSCGIDATNLVVEALRKVGDDRAAIRDTIENTRNWMGLNGFYNMSPTDHNGLSLEDMILMKVENGRFRIIKN